MTKPGEPALRSTSDVRRRLGLPFEKPTKETDEPAAEE